MRRRDGHEAVAPGLLHRLLAGAHERIVGTRERDLVHDDELAARPGDVDALPQRQGAEETGPRVGGEVLDQLAQGLLALEEDRVLRDARAQFLGGHLGRAHRGEQPQRAASRRLDQLGQLVEHVTAVAVPGGAGQVLGDVEDALLAVVEGGADVDALPLGHVVALGALGCEPQGGPDAVEVAAQLQRRGGQDHRAVGEELLPQQPRDGHRSDPQRRAEPVVALVPDDVPLGAVRDPLRHVVHGLH